MTATKLPSGVGFTAIVGAAARAWESKQDKRLFADPLAARFVAAARARGMTSLGPAPDEQPSEYMYGILCIFAVRLPFHDNNLLRHAAAGSRQVVLLGAGFDTRAFRLSLPPGTVVYEVDTPQVLNFKATVLAGHQPRVETVPVPADLRDDWPAALVAAGFDRSAPTTWMSEGVLMYLDAPDAEWLAVNINALSAPGSKWLGDTLNRPPTMKDLPATSTEDLAGARLWVSSCRTGPAEEPIEWLAEHGWRCEQFVDFTRLLARCGRRIPAVFDPRRTNPLRYWHFAAVLG